MTNRFLAVSAAALLALGAAACSQVEQDKTQADANQAGAEAKVDAEKAGSALKEEASQVGSAIVAGASEAAQEVDEATDALAAKADEQKAETATDHQGNAPATSPAH